MRTTAHTLALAIALASSAATWAIAQPGPAPSVGPKTGSWLGVFISGPGAMVSDVLPNTPAARGGVRPGDVITRVGPIDIDSATELIATVSALKPGTAVDLQVLRARSFTTQLQVVVEAKPEPSEMLRRRFLGQAVQDFRLPQIGGGEISLTDLRGEVVVIEHFGTWDKDCRATFQTLAELADRGAIVLGLSGEGSEALQKFVARGSPPFAVLDDVVSRVQRQYDTSEIPLIVVVDRAGIIRHIGVGASRSELGRAFDAAVAALAQRPGARASR